MTLADVLDAARRRRKTLVVHGADPGDLPDRFETRNVEVVAAEDRDLDDDPYVAVRDGDDFRAAVDLADFEAFFASPDADDGAGGAAARHALHELLDDAVFASLSERQLLSTAVEIEDRAYRTGRGELHAGFQTWTAFERQADRYRRFARETDLDVTVYVRPDGGGSPPGGVTVHETAHPDVGEYWFVVFDGGDDGQQCALVAEQTDADDFRGVWTYDEALVADALAAVDDFANPPSP